MILAGNENEDIDEDVQENEVLIPLETEGEDGNDKVQEKPKDHEMEEEKNEGNKKQKVELPSVIFLTEENKNNYTLHNLVVPLVGRDIPLETQSSVE